jgi:hypothetical protein
MTHKYSDTVDDTVEWLYDLLYPEHGRGGQAVLTVTVNPANHNITMTHAQLRRLVVMAERGKDKA